MINDQSLKDYEKYIRGLSFQKLIDVVDNIDREQNPEKYLLAREILSERGGGYSAYKFNPGRFPRSIRWVLTFCLFTGFSGVFEGVYYWQEIPDRLYNTLGSLGYIISVYYIFKGKPWARLTLMFLVGLGLLAQMEKISLHIYDRKEWTSEFIMWRIAGISIWSTIIYFLSKMKRDGYI